MREKIGVFLVILFIGVVAFADSPYTNKPISPPEGSTNITTLGTVTTGTWEGTKIGIGYGGTNATNATDARTNLGLGTLATQNADNAIVTNLTVGGVANVTGTVTAGTISANVIKTDTSADATLSGTPIIITVYDAASNTPYYFKAYPVK